MKRYKHLSQEQRYHIYALLKVGLSQKKIAQELSVCPSTISRELHRNKGLKGYRPIQAHKRAVERKTVAARRNAYRIPDLTRNVALKLIEEDWSPDQIAHALKRYGHPVSHESIYQWVIADRRQGGSLYLHLRRRQRKYNRRHGKDSGRGLIPNRTPIEQRPAVANKRLEFGHWEADTVVGTRARGAVLVTLIERKSRFLLAVKARSKGAEDVSAALLEALEPYKDMVRSITFDNGKEFCSHEQIADTLACQTYFANSYHSWERGSNENANGLLRQYFPKGKSLDPVSSEKVLWAQDRINNRPKRVLGYNSPERVFTKALRRYQRRQEKFGDSAILSRNCT